MINDTILKNKIVKDARLTPGIFDFRNNPRHQLNKIKYQRVDSRKKQSDDPDFIVIKGIDNFRNYIISQRKWIAHYIPAIPSLKPTQINAKRTDKKNHGH